MLCRYQISKYAITLVIVHANKKTRPDRCFYYLLASVLINAQKSHLLLNGVWHMHGICPNRAAKVPDTAAFVKYIILLQKSGGWGAVC